MKVQELRIGNYVFCLETNGIQQITGVTEENVYLNCVTFDYLEHDEIEPIPLTEEWILKFGAVKLDSKDFLNFNLFGMQINCIDGIWVEYTHRIELKGIHHLQNLFYFTRKEELTIKK